MRSRLIAIFVCIISGVFIINISASIYALSQKGTIVSEREEIRDELKTAQDTLKERLEYVNSPNFVEKEAREKLNLQRQGETVVVLPKEVTGSAQASTPSQPLTNWQQWLKLFF